MEGVVHRSVPVRHLVQPLLIWTCRFSFKLCTIWSIFFVFRDWCRETDSSAGNLAIFTLAPGNGRVLAGGGFLWNYRMLRKSKSFRQRGAGAVGSSRYRRPGDDVMLRRVCYHEDGAGSMEMMSCAFRLQDDIMLPRHIGDDVILYFVTLFLIFQIFVKIWK